jgi:hypothetical protein
MVITTLERNGTFDGVEAPDGRYICCAHCAQRVLVPETRASQL